MRYRTSILYALLAMSVIRAAAAQRVVVADPFIKIVSNGQMLRDVCASDVDFDACTRFVAYRLRTSCVLTNDRWTIDASATFKPWIVLHNLHSLSHEQLHIADVRTFIERYIDSLSRDPFEQRDACEASALTASSGFEATIRGFAVRSNALRHPNIIRLAHK